MTSEDLEGESGPPPLPFGATGERVPTIAPAARPRGRGRRAAVVAVALLLVAGAGFVGGLATSDRIDVPGPLRDRAALEAERDVELVGLLEEIVRTEGVMLTFNEVVGERIGRSSSEAEALAAVAEAAASGVGGLEALRPLIVDRTDGGWVDDVRTAYLPHLDSWIEYLAALAAEPAVLFDRDDQQPYILRINATADVFRLALEELLTAGPSARAGELAERILDDGFRTEGPEPNV